MVLHARQGEIHVEPGDEEKLSESIALRGGKPHGVNLRLLLGAPADDVAGVHNDPLSSEPVESAGADVHGVGVRVCAQHLGNVAERNKSPQIAPRECLHKMKKQAEQPLGTD